MKLPLHIEPSLAETAPKYIKGWRLYDANNVCLISGWDAIDGKITRQEIEQIVKAIHFHKRLIDQLNEAHIVLDQPYPPISSLRYLDDDIRKLLNELSLS